MIKIYHNPSCKKSRAGLQLLRESGHPFEIVNYMKNPLSENQVEQLLVKMNLKPSDLLRTKEDYYKQHIKGKRFEDHELVRIILQNPKLLIRPIVESKYRAVLGDPAENITPLLK